MQDFRASELFDHPVKMQFYENEIAMSPATLFARNVITAERSLNFKT